MKWYNKTKTKCLDTHKVSYWEYTSNKEQERLYEENTWKKMPVKSYLLVVVDGCEREFDGEESEEIYLILKDQKELI